MLVTFFLTGESDLQRLRDLDPDCEPLEFVTGERVWILQTYLRLAIAGYPVQLADRPPERGVLVFHAKQAEALLRHWRRWSDCILIGVRADHGESHLADFEVVQNRVWEDGASKFFVPTWTQPGLLPRDHARGERIERVVFKGFENSLDPAFTRNGLAEALRSRGIEFVVDAVEYEGGETDRQKLLWADYRDVDLVLAVRPPNGRYTGKPAGKLCNAWLAGAPALLGPEPAFRELRTHPLDYIEVTSVAEVVAAVDRLRAEPTLYRAMVEHGRARAAAFSLQAIRSKWIDFLWRRVPALSAARPLRSVPALLRPAMRWVNRILQQRPLR